MHDTLGQGAIEPPKSRSQLDREPAKVKHLAQKRVLDLTLIALALPVVVPLIGMIGLVAWAIQGSPVLFRQQRPGFNGRPFTIYKFRTMRESEGTSLEPEGQRLTRFGKLLRSTSLDELPELMNVIKGNMSLVGPRPLLMEYLAYYTPELQRRHHVLPGITGWAQVNGRNTTPWERRFALDLWYVDHQSTRLDVTILLLSIWKVLTRDGVMQPGEACSFGNFKGLSSSKDPQQ
jgi:sugar transferase EpsL